MLKIKCVYCGQKILADDDKMGTKAHCPKCNHLILINEAALIKKREKDLGDDEINRLLHSKKSKSDILGRPCEYREREKLFLRKWFAPDFDELSMFLMVAAAVLVAATNNDIGDNITKYTEAIYKTKPNKEAIVLLGIITFALFGGASLPILHVFINRPKHKWEKMVMLIFAVAFTAGSGIFAGEAMLKEAARGIDASFATGRHVLPFITLLVELKWRAIFPLWNIANGVFMIWLFNNGIIDTGSIIDGNTKLWEVFLGLAILAVVFVVCQYGFKTHWAVTYSICIVYSTNFAKWGQK